MTEIKALHPAQAPQAIGPYSPAIKVTSAQELLFLSGQLPIVPETGLLLTDPAQATEQCMKNIGVLLREAGMDFNNIVDVLILLKNIVDFAVVNEVYASYMQQPYPARMTFQAGALPKDAVVEIKVTAVK